MSVRLERPSTLDPTLTNVDPSQHLTRASSGIHVRIVTARCTLSRSCQEGISVEQIYVRNAAASDISQQLKDGSSIAAKAVHTLIGRE